MDLGGGEAVGVMLGGGCRVVAAISKSQVKMRSWNVSCQESPLAERLRLFSFSIISMSRALSLHYLFVKEKDSICT